MRQATHQQLQLLWSVERDGWAPTHRVEALCKGLKLLLNALVEFPQGVQLDVLITVEVGDGDGGAPGLELFSPGRLMYVCIYAYID